MAKQARVDDLVDDEEDDAAQLADFDETQGLASHLFASDSDVG